MPETIFTDRRKDTNRRMRSMSDGSVTNGMLHCRRRARDRRQAEDLDSSHSWWLNVNYAVSEDPGLK